MKALGICLNIGPAIALLVLSNTLNAQSATPDTAPRTEDRIITGKFESKILGRVQSYSLVLPESPPPSGNVPVLVILHGLGRNENTLIDDPATRRILLDAPFASLMPEGDGGWYIDSPCGSSGQYASYLDEAIRYASRKHGLSTEAAHCGICGWSMGGYGAIMTAIRRPRDFAAVASIIGLLDYPNKDLPEGRNFEIKTATFGTDPAFWDTLNPIRNASRLEGVPILLVVGDRSFDLMMNRNFAAELARLGIGHEWVSLSQGHTFGAVQEGLPLVVDFMKKKILPTGN